MIRDGQTDVQRVRENEICHGHGHDTLSGWVDFETSGMRATAGMIRALKLAEPRWWTNSLTGRSRLNRTGQQWSPLKHRGCENRYENWALGLAGFENVHRARQGRRRLSVAKVGTDRRSGHDAPPFYIYRDRALTLMNLKDPALHSVYCFPRLSSGGLSVRARLYGRLFHYPTQSGLTTTFFPR